MVTNVLKTGEVVADLKGHIVKRADVPMAYEVLERKSKGEQRWQVMRKSRKRMTR